MARINSPTAIHKIWHHVNAVYDKSPEPDKPAPPEMDELKRKVENGLLKLKNQGVQLTSARTPALAAPEPGGAVNTRVGEFLKQRERVHVKMLRLCQLLKRNRQHEDAKRFPKYFQRVKELTASVGALDPTHADFDTQHEADDKDLDGTDVTGVEQALDRPDLATAVLDDDDEMTAGPPASAAPGARADEMAAGPPVTPPVAPASRPTPAAPASSPAAPAPRPTPAPAAPASASEFLAVQQRFKNLLPEARACEHHRVAGDKVKELILAILHHLEHHEAGPAAQKMDMLQSLVNKVPPDERIWHGVMDDEEQFKHAGDDRELMKQLLQAQAERRSQQEQKAKEKRQKWQEQVEGVEKMLRERSLENVDTNVQLQRAHARIAQGKDPARELHELQIFVAAAAPELEPEEYRRRLAEIPLPEGEVSPTVLKRLQGERENILSLIQQGNDDPEPLLVSLRRYTVESRDTYARRQEFQGQLDDLSWPEGLPPDRLANLVAMRDGIVSLIDNGMNPETAIKELKTQVEEIKANKSREGAFISRLARIPSPKGKTVPQAVELEELRTRINKAIEAGENPEALLNDLESRARQMEAVNAGREEFQKRLAAIPRPRGPLNEAQKKLDKELREEIVKAIDGSVNPEGLLAALEKYVGEVETVNQRRVTFDRELASLRDPPGRSERQAAALNELRTQITSDLDKGIDPGERLTHLRGYLEDMAGAIERRQKDVSRLERIADAQGQWRERLEGQGANPKQLARILRLRRHIEMVLEEDRDATKLVDQLDKEVNGFVKINRDRQKWEEELKAITIPAGMPQDQLVAWEELRLETRMEIDDGTDPAANLKKLRQLAGVN
jgi:hypothetical protein